MTPNAVETHFLDRLPSGDLRDLLKGQGLPHRRDERWKWSDVRNAVQTTPVHAGKLNLKASRSAEYKTKLGIQQSFLMTQLAYALAEKSQVYTLVDGEHLSLDFHVEPGITQKFITLYIPEGVRARSIENYALEPGAFANIVIRVIVEQNAELDRVIVQDASPDSVLIATSEVTLNPQARLSQTTLGFGAKLARLETRVENKGGDAQLNLSGAYLLNKGLHFDQTSHIYHTGPNGKTDQLFKGAVGEGSTGVFQGKIHVDQSAQKTDAQMQHRGLLLNDKGTIYAKPELEIYADDVICAHGNALGAIDEDALFYMRQRGIDYIRSRALLTESFLVEPFDFVGDSDIKQQLVDKLKTQLNDIG